MAPDKGELPKAWNSLKFREMYIKSHPEEDLGEISDETGNFLQGLREKDKDSELTAQNLDLSQVEAKESPNLEGKAQVKKEAAVTGGYQMIREETPPQLPKKH